MDRPATAKLFRNGRSQAVRLPAKFRFEGADEVFVSKVGDKVVLSAKPSSWDDFFAAKPEPAVAQGFLARRNDRPPQKRRLFK
jgi:antitoxin VapB